MKNGRDIKDRGSWQFSTNSAVLPRTAQGHSGVKRYLAVLTLLFLKSYIKIITKKGKRYLNVALLSIL